MKIRSQTLLTIFLIILILPLVLYILVGSVLTIISKLDSRQFQFTKGGLPSEPLNGNYSGSALFQANWRGKYFNSADQTGLNNFQIGESVYQQFKFKTYVGKGLLDDKEVLKIDYDLPENPFFVRWVVDEIVEVERGKYLGKAHVRVLPFMPFTIIYFSLEK
jgi:hypothetical protein